MNIPNILTLFRLFLVPLFGYYLYHESFVIATLIYILAALTDVLDGYIARRFNMVTSWGKIADPAADKLMTVTALTILTILGRIKVYVIIIVVVKEAIMALGGFLIYKNKKHVVSANWYGKMSTVVFNVAIVLLIIGTPYNDIIISIAVVSALFALFMYVLAYFRFTKSQF